MVPPTICRFPFPERFPPNFFSEKFSSPELGEEPFPVVALPSSLRKAAFFFLYCFLPMAHNGAHTR